METLEDQKAVVKPEALLHNTLSDVIANVPSGEGQYNPERFDTVDTLISYLSGEEVGDLKSKINEFFETNSAINSTETYHLYTFRELLKTVELYKGVENDSTKEGYQNELKNTIFVQFNSLRTIARNTEIVQ